VIKPKHISTEPDFQESAIKDGFIIIACDGVWDEMSSEEAVNIMAW
jgi:serine/threonine protein phosphatase PrpC